MNCIVVGGFGIATKNTFNRAEGKKSKRNRPQSEWIRREAPELRIIFG